MANTPPGKGLFGWLGRQVGHVKKAVQAEPKALTQSPQKPATPGPSTGAAPKPSAVQSDSKVLYREGRVEEADHPTQPGVKLRRTVIDEVIVDKDPGKKN
jgi:hypothetical protein